MFSKSTNLRLVIVLSVLLVGAAFWIFETFTLTVTRVNVKSAKVKNSVTVVQITDLHGSSFGKENARLIKLIEQQKPDLIAATGDMFSFDDREGMNVAAELLIALAKNNTVFYVNGEHDNSAEFSAMLMQGGVRVLEYDTEDVTVGETKLRIYGIDNVYYTRTFDLLNAFDDPVADAYNILLAHIPYFDAFMSFGTDLSLCGDTHGGQVRLPLIGAVRCDGVWFPSLRNEPFYDKGLFQKDDKLMFISSGLGNYPLAIRLMNRPEIAVITIEPK
ncbi:MAG: metallophosphoesterase [Oscillospiraceae bacterium]